MDNYIVSARKYRPSTFASVVGQKALTSTLKNAIASDRLAHAYLFCGSRGVGKTSCARIFAKTINCTNPTPDGDPCNECDSCRAFNESRSLNIIELDAASNNSVDDIRQLVDQVQVPPTSGRYRVFIIDEVHMLSNAAFNAFLKTLEEPPSYVVFILATTEKHKVIPTILSRCQIYDFSRITVSDMVEHLAYVAASEGIEAERAALGVIARKADGAMRDALSIFDQVAASSRGNITYRSAVENLNVLDDSYYTRLVRTFIDKDVEQALLIYKEVRDHGFDSHHFVNGLAAYLRDLMVARSGATATLLDADTQTREEMSQLAQEVPVEFFYDAMSLCNDVDLNYRVASSKSFLVELLLIRLCQLLGPSPTCNGTGEGQLQPIAVNPAAPGTQHPASPAPAAGRNFSEAGTSVPGNNNARPAQSSTPGNPTVSRTFSGAGTSVPGSNNSRPAQSSTFQIQNPSAPVPPPPAPIGAKPGARKVIRSTHAAPTATTQNSTSNIQNSQNAAPAAPRNNRFSYRQLREAWDSFAAARPKEALLVNTFRACPPQPTRDETVFNVILENPLQVEQLKSLMPVLMPHLCDAIGNDYLRLDLQINQSGPAPHIWNDTEILHHLLETVPYLPTMMKELNLKLI